MHSRLHGDDELPEISSTTPGWQEQGQAAGGGGRETGELPAGPCPRLGAGKGPGSLGTRLLFSATLPKTFVFRLEVSWDG